MTPQQEQAVRELAEYGVEGVEFVDEALWGDGRRWLLYRYADGSPLFDAPVVLVADDGRVAVYPWTAAIRA